MMNGKHRIFATALVCAALQHVHAQSLTPLVLKNGKTLDLSTVTFKPMCMEDGCGKKPSIPKFRPKDICILAMCLPLEASAIKTVLPAHAEHWRIYPNNTMRLFRGDVPLLAAAVPATAPLIDATQAQVQHTPVLVQADENGHPVKYWVRVAR
jgi:hypothetical protein